jgi:hypothetical protein
MARRWLFLKNTTYHRKDTVVTLPDDQVPADAIPIDDILQARAVLPPARLYILERSGDDALKLLARLRKAAGLVGAEFGSDDTTWAGLADTGFRLIESYLERRLTDRIAE